MSKTISTCICETNLVPNHQQENVFFHTLYRQQAEFASEFIRTARSTSPIQICALFSTQGPDNLAAFLNIELNKELSRLVATTQKNSVLDFDSFAKQVINVLNVKVCNFIVANQGTQLKTSMTLLVIEGDTLRIISVGNTRAVLIRDSRIFSLTEEHTVAHRYVKMGAITPEQEATHPENMTLTQYLGKMPQDGDVVADTNVHLKLKENDELCIMGVGISKKAPAQIRNTVLVKPTTTEIKCKELVNASFNYGIKAGLTAIIIKIESVFLLPGDAVFGSNEEKVAATPVPTPTSKAPVSSDTKSTYSDFTSTPITSKNVEQLDEDDEPEGDTTMFNSGKLNVDSVEKVEKSSKKTKILNIVIPIIIIIVFAVIGYFIMFGVFNAAHLMDSFNEAIGQNDAILDERIVYAVNDNVPVYSEESLDSTIVATLNRGDAVTRKSMTDSFSYVILSGGVEGYVLNVQLQEEDPTMNDGLPVMEADPTPVPTEETTVAQDTQPAVETDAAPTDTTVAVTETTTAPTTAATTAATEATTEATTTVAETEATTTEAPAETTAETAAPTEATEATTEATTAAPTETEAPAEASPETPAD